MRERERERVHKPVKSVVLKDNMDMEKFSEQQFLITGIGAKLEVKAMTPKSLASPTTLSMLVVKHHFQIQLRTSI